VKKWTPGLATDQVFGIIGIIGIIGFDFIEFGRFQIFQPSFLSCSDV
jgi:hypothetical protein